MAEVPLVGVPPEEASEYEDALRLLPSDVLAWARGHLQIVVLVAEDAGIVDDDRPVGVTLPPSGRWTAAVATPGAVLHEVAYAWLGHTRPRNDEDERTATELAAQWREATD